MKIICGSNRLIVNGEKCILGAADILKHYMNIEPEHEYGTKIKVEESLKSVYEIISKRKIGIDEMCQKLNCHANEILPKLMMLELNGLIVRSPGNLYSKKNI